MSRESEWVSSWIAELAKRIQKSASPGFPLCVEAGRKLPYAVEVLSYADGELNEKHISRYETDVLICECDEIGNWTPRVAIECKLGSVTTHDALTYSTKASTHKNVHPYLRYGVLIGGWCGMPLPARLVRHGAHFDFMTTWNGELANAREWRQLTEVVAAEVRASRQLQELLTTRARTKQRYSMMHRRLELHAYCGH